MVIAKHDYKTQESHDQPKIKVESSVVMVNYQSALFKMAALGCVVANYGRYQLGKEVSICAALQSTLWLGYR